MNEHFLHYIWRHQYFDKKDLKTVNSEKVEILSTGHYNTDAGPDFINARIKIGSVEWYGNIEIHSFSSDWYKHRHQNDDGYENVVLHVVYENDRDIIRKDKSIIPTIEIKDRLDTRLFEKYAGLVSSAAPFIPCSSYVKNIPEIVKISMLEKALIQRLQKKGQEILNSLKKNEGDWDETIFQLLAKNFGFKLNEDPFSRLAKSLPFKIIQKHKDNLFQIEALLFGRAGMLSVVQIEDEYYHQLKREYEYLSHKYSLVSVVSSSDWKFLRLRPSNFPTVRIAQMAGIVLKNDSLLNCFSTDQSSSVICKNLKKGASEYWRTHYTFGKKSKVKQSDLGRDSLEILIINTVVPLWVALSIYKDQEELMDKAISLLEDLNSEKNRITKGWNTIGLSLKNAADSQAGIELFNCYCKHSLCLNCSIGTMIVKN